MGLFSEPILKKFFVNKIESSRPEWGDYLLEVADIFSSSDGDDYDYDSLREKFSVMSGRSPYAFRDVSNYRDEYGAYGTYLGLFRVERIDGKLKMFLSNAARHLLCSTEPDVECFCRVQLSMFQYPNGAGAVLHKGGTVSLQGNVRKDTVREIENGVRVNPLRLLCRIVVALHEISAIPLTDIHISYQQIFMLINDDRINSTFSPDKGVIVATLDEYANTVSPAWVTAGKNLSNFKRNFHILEWTGLFTRDRDGFVVNAENVDKVYSYISEISEMTAYFDGFDDLYGETNISNKVKSVVSSLGWGDYYDALTLPMQTLTLLTNPIEDEDIAATALPIGSIPPLVQPFPELRSFKSNEPRAFISNGKAVDPFETVIRREKANREHARILSMLAAMLRFRYDDVFENTFVDLFVTADNQPFIFEVKSNNSRNVLSQIRKAVAQLYEYRYRSELPQAILCIVLQEKPPQDWVVDYLLNDRDILVCWLVDTVRLECPAECHQTLANIGVVV